MEKFGSEAAKKEGRKIYREDIMADKEADKKLDFKEEFAKDRLGAIQKMVDQGKGEKK